MKKNNKKGFTLAELLIVVAIIAVLVAIAIPVFTAQLEKSREATDLANIRAAYAEVMVEAIEDNSASAKTIDLKQIEAGWKTADAEDTLESIFGSGNVSGSIVAGSSNTATITWVAGSGSSEGHCTLTLN